MTFSWDLNTATLATLLTQAVIVIVFMVRTANTANSAKQDAAEAKKLAQEAHEKAAALHGLLSLHREQVAREFADKIALREMETRLSGSIDRLSDRIDEVLSKT